MLEVSRESLDQVGEDWRRLAAASVERSVFSSPEWHAALEDSSVLEPGRSLLLVVKEGDSVVGLAPLRQTPSAVTFTGGTDLVDYHHVLYPAERAVEVCQAIVRSLTRDFDWKRVSLVSLPADAPSLVHLPAAFRAEGCAVVIEDEDSCPVIGLPASWDGYLEGLTAKQRHELRRKLRRLDEIGGTRFRSDRTGAGLEQGLDVFFELQRLAAPDKRAFWTAARQDFVRAIGAKLAAHDQVRLHTLWLHSTPIAASLNFVQNGCWYAYNSAYHPGHRALSPGFVNHALGIREAIIEGGERFDFLRGKEPYKYLLGARDRGLCAIQVRRSAAHVGARDARFSNHA